MATSSFSSQPGDLIIVACKAADVGATFSASDANGALTALTRRSINDGTERFDICVFYRIATATQASNTITFTNTNSIDYREIRGALYRPGSGESFTYDGEHFGQTLFGTSVSTSSFNTTAPGVIFSICHGYYNNATTYTPGSNYTPGFGAADNFALLMERFTSGALSGEVITTTASTSHFLAQVGAAFTTGAGGSLPKLLTLGVG